MAEDEIMIEDDAIALEDTDDTAIEDEDVSNIIVTQRTEDPDKPTDETSAREWLLDTPDRRRELSRARITP